MKTIVPPEQPRTPMKPSTARLYSMLPRVFVLRLDIVAGEVAGADALDADAKPCGIDANYPGFAECLMRLVTSGHVVHAADIQTGSPTKGRLERWFITMRAAPLPPINPPAPPASN